MSVCTVRAGGGVDAVGVDSADAVHFERVRQRLWVHVSALRARCAPRA